MSFSVPVRVDGRGEVYIGQYSGLGDRFAPRFGKGDVLLQARVPHAVIKIGEKCSLSNNITLVARTRIELGDHCLVSDKVTILDADFHVIDPQARKEGGGPGETKAVEIGDNCWIGTDAMILKGVKISENSIVAKVLLTSLFQQAAFLQEYRQNL